MCDVVSVIIINLFLTVTWSVVGRSSLISFFKNSKEYAFKKKVISFVFITEFKTNRPFGLK